MTKKTLGQETEESMQLYKDGKFKQACHNFNRLSRRIEDRYGFDSEQHYHLQLLENLADYRAIRAGQICFDVAWNQNSAETDSMGEIRYYAEQLLKCDALTNEMRQEIESIMGKYVNQPDLPWGPNISHDVVEFFNRTFGDKSE